MKRFIPLSLLLAVVCFPATARTDVVSSRLNINDVFSGVKTPVTTIRTIPEASPAAPASTVKATVNFVYDHEKFAPCVVVFMAQTSDATKFFEISLLEEEADSYTFDLEPGVYQAVALYKNLATMMGGPVCYVVLEDCDLTSDKTLDFDVATSTQYISFSSYNPDGQPTRLHKVKLGDDGLELVEAGNVFGTESFTSLVFEEKVAFPYTVFTNTDFTIEEFNHIGLANSDVYINKVSDRWSFVHSRNMAAIDKSSLYAVYLKAIPSESGSDISVTNQPSGYYIYEQPVPASIQDGPFKTSTSYRLCDIGTGGALSIDFKTSKAYVSIPPKGLGENFTVVYATYVDGKLNTTPVELNPTAPGSYMPSLPLNTYSVVWPYVNSMAINPGFFSPVSDVSVPGSSSPVIYAGISRDWINATSTVPTAQASVAGFLGARRPGAGTNLKKSITCGDREILGNNSSLSDFATLWKRAGKPTGEMTMTLIDDTYTRGEIAGRTESVTVWDNTRSDDVPPVLTFLQTVDADGIVTDEFENPEGAMVRFSAADFIPDVEFNVFGYEGYNLTWYSYAPVTVKAEYAPVWTDAFEELTVTENQGALVERGWGAFYTAPLGDITRTASYGWYKLRLTVTDAVGNYQQQTISPAFRIKSLAGIETIDADSNAAATIYYDLQGRRINHGHMQPGVYIEVKGASARKVAIQ